MYAFFKFFYFIFSRYVIGFQFVLKLKLNQTYIIIAKLVPLAPYFFFNLLQSVKCFMEINVTYIQVELKSLS